MRTVRGLLTLAVATAGLTSAPAARAAELLYTLTGDYDARWTIDAALPPAIDVPDIFITYTGLAGVFPGSLPPGIAEICFFSADLGGGFEIDQNGDDTVHYVEAAGPALYDESGGTPVLATGDFDFAGYDDLTGSPDPSRSYHLTVVAVPEPGAWAMLIAGAGFAGALLRRRRGWRPAPA